MKIINFKIKFILTLIKHFGQSITTTYYVDCLNALVRIPQITLNLTKQKRTGKILSFLWRSDKYIKLPFTPQLINPNIKNKKDK